MSPFAVLETYLIFRDIDSKAPKATASGAVFILLRRNHPWGRRRCGELAGVPGSGCHGHRLLPAPSARP